MLFGVSSSLAVPHWCPRMLRHWWHGFSKRCLCEVWSDFLQDSSLGASSFGVSLASLLGKASRARAAGAKPLQPERASSALSAKRLVFSKDFLVCLSRFVVFFPNARVSSRRSLASEGCRGEAPAARASEMRRDRSDTLGFSFFCAESEPRSCHRKYRAGR